MKNTIIEHIFPIKFLYTYAEKNKLLTYIILIISLAFSIYRGHAFIEISNPYGIINFFDSWHGITKMIFATFIVFYYSSFGHCIWLIAINIVYLFLIYSFSGIKNNINFINFIFPFLSLCYFSAVLWGLTFVLLIFSINLPRFIAISICFYWLISYCLILIWKYDVPKKRSVTIVFLPFIGLFLFGGYPIIAPYLCYM